MKIPGIKHEHLAIAKEFQTLDQTGWKSIKIQSNKTTDKISVLASLNVQDMNDEMILPFTNQN